MSIENVCDMISGMQTTAGLKREVGESGASHKKRTKDDKTLPKLQALIDQPNPEETRQDFVRAVLQDMLVGDWASVLVRKTPKVEVKEIRAIDGATTTRNITKQGYTTEPPSPPYAQLWYVIPMVDLTTDQLIHAVRT